MATFFCRCETPHAITFTGRSFCTVCSYLVTNHDTAHCTICPGCNINECWEQMGAPCFSCQLASITFQNPLASFMETLINTWLPMDLDTDSNDCDASTYKNATYERNVRQKNSTKHMINSQPQHLMSNFRGLVQQRQASINASIESIKAKTSANGNRKIFTELTALWKSISALHSQDTSVDHNNISKG
jgi:hypothetical protein